MGQSGPRPSASTTTSTSSTTRTDSTGLAADEIKCLKTCFDLFDTKKVDFLSADDLGEIMRAMGFRPTEEELKELLLEIDEDGSGEIEFAEFCQLCATFLVEDPDMETMKRELKDAFRIYDKEGLGYITTETLSGLIGELLAPLTEEELEGILEELDEDGSGSMDFDEFCEMMMKSRRIREKKKESKQDIPSLAQHNNIAPSL